LIANQNGDVNRPTSRTVSAAVLLVAVSVAATTFAELASSRRAMACCAKTHNKCAGIKRPDDCCKGMGHGVTAMAATVTKLKAHAGCDAVATAATPVAATAANALRLAVSPIDFKRPHDPPHLHPFPLLI
jgi:hypothetical protein